MKKISLLVMLLASLLMADYYCPTIRGVEYIAVSKKPRQCVPDCTKINDKQKRVACKRNQVGRIDECKSYYCALLDPKDGRCQYSRNFESSCLMEKSSTTGQKMDPKLKDLVVRLMGE